MNQSLAALPRRFGLPAALLVALLVAILFGACTQLPTEKQGVTDMRPQLSFKVADDSLRSARIVIDGLDMGAVGEHLEGAATLRVLPGTHLVRVYMNGGPIVEEKIYVGDGVNRTILVK